MRNRTAGLLVIGIALLIGVIVFWFNRALTDIVNSSCSHGPSCPMWGTIDFQTNVGLAVIALVVLIGLYLIFLAKDDKPPSVIVKTIKQPAQQALAKKPSRENYKDVLRKLDEEERAILEFVIDGEGTALQSELVEKTGLGKVKVTRVLDSLEVKGLVERRRRGMTNVIVLKPQ